MKLPATAPGRKWPGQVAALAIARVINIWHGKPVTGLWVSRIMYSTASRITERRVLQTRQCSIPCAYLNQPGYITVAKGAKTSSTGAAVASSTVKADLGGILGSGGMKLVVEGLDLDTTGYRKAAVEMPLEDPDQAWIPASNLSMKHHYVLLDNAWNAASPSQAKSRVKNMVPTDLLDNGVIRTGLNLVGSIFPEIRSDNLEFGKVDVEVAPCQRLSTYSGSTAPSACR